MCPTADAQNDGGYGEGREGVCGSEVAPPDLPEGGGVQIARSPQNFSQNKIAKEGGKIA